MCVTALLGVGFIYSGDFVDSYSMHAAFQGVIMRGLELGWPPPNLLLPEVAWSYNYAAHLWLHGVMLTTGLPIDVLVTRYGPVFLGGASAALMLAFGRYLVGLAWWIAILPVICVYWVIGVPPIAWPIIRQLYAVWSQSNSIAVSGHFDIFPGPYIRFGKAERARFLSRSSCHACHAYISGDRCERCLSPDPALCIVAPAGCDELAKRKIGPQKSDPSGRGANWICGGFAIFLYSWNRILRRGALKFVGQPFSFLTGADQPVLTLPHTLMRWGLPWLPSGLVAFAVIAVFQAAFLTPVLPASFVEIRKRMRDVDILLIGSAIAGIGGFFLTEAPGLSHISFLYFSSISFSLLGGWDSSK